MDIYILYLQVEQMPCCEFLAADPNHPPTELISRQTAGAAFGAAASLSNHCSEPPIGLSPLKAANLRRGSTFMQCAEQGQACDSARRGIDPGTSFASSPRGREVGVVSREKLRE